jgi:hypothetical protein
MPQELPCMKDLTLELIRRSRSDTFPPFVSDARVHTLRYHRAACVVVEKLEDGESLEGPMIPRAPVEKR